MWARPGSSRPLEGVRLPDEISELMATQDGLVTVAQLQRHGVGRWQRSKLVADGWIWRVAPRVYRLRGAPETAHWRLRAGLLCLGDGACVSFEAAAALHRFHGADPGAVEFTVPRRRRSLVVPFVVHTTTDLDPIDLVTIDDMAVTAPARTIIDLALAGADDERLETLIRAAVRTGVLTLGDLATRSDALRASGRWGSRRVALIVERMSRAPVTGSSPTAGVPRLR